MKNKLSPQARLHFARLNAMYESIRTSTRDAAAELRKLTDTINQNRDEMQKQANVDIVNAILNSHKN